jgi:hypothetical protein
MKMARLCTLLICAVGLASRADANEISQGFNSILTLPADGWVMVNNSNPLTTNSSLVGTPALTATKQPAPYIDVSSYVATFTPVSNLTNGNAAASLAPSTLSAANNLDVPFSTNSVFPASFTLEPPSVSTLNAIATGSYYLPPIYPFIVSDNYYPSASFAFLADDAEAPEPNGVSLGLLGCAMLVAVAAWRRKNIAA